MRARSAWLPAFAALAAGCAASPPQDLYPIPGELELEGRQMNFGAGLRTFDDPNFGRLDHEIALALDYCEPIGFRFARLEGGLHYTRDDADGTSGGQDVRLRAQTLELSAGVNVAQLLGRLRPYVGFGGSLLFLNLRGVDQADDTVFDDDDAVVGGYVKAGILFQITATSHFGFEARHFEGGNASLDQQELGTRYDQLVFVFGTSFWDSPYSPFYGGYGR